MLQELRRKQKAESRAVEAPDESSVREDMSREASPLSNAEAERVENVPQTESDTSKRAAKPQTEVNSKETAEKAKNKLGPEVNSKAESEIASDGNDGISEEAHGVLETIRRTAQSPKEALKAKKHGDVYSGADEQTIRVAEDLSKAFGVRILLFDGNGKTDIDGFYDRKANSIYLNAGSHAKPLQATVRHEMVHFLAQANKGAFEAFRDFVAGRYAETYGKDALNMWLDNKKAEYEAAGIELDENGAKEELCADLAMDMLTDPETVKGFAKENRSAARRILGALRRFIDKIRVFFGLEPKYTAGKAHALETLAKTDSTVKITDGKVERSHASFKNDTLPKALNVKDLYAAEKLLYNALVSAEIRNSNTNSDGIQFSGPGEEKSGIRYSKSGTAADTKKNVFSYEALTAKPDMPLTDINTSIPRDANGKVIRKDVADRALKAVRDSGNKKNTDVDSYVHVDDTNSDLKVNVASVRHSLTRKPDLNAIAALNIVGLAKNAVLVNELSPRGNSNGGNVYLSVGKDSDRNLYFVRMITDKRGHSIEEIETVYAISTKKESVAHYRQGYENKIPFAFTDSTISIADLLDFVKNHFSDVLPESVLQHYGISRKESAVSDSVMYSLNAEKDSVQTIPKGEDPARDVDVRAFDERGGKVSEGIRTVRFTSICKRRIRLHRSSGMS